MKPLLLRAIAGAAAAVVLAAGCSSTEKPKPTPLETVQPQIAGRQAWTARLDSVRFPLAVAVRDGAFIVAATDGAVASYEAATGRELWRGNAGGRIVAGVGSDGRYSAVVTQANEVVVLDHFAASPLRTA